MRFIFYYLLLVLLLGFSFSSYAQDHPQSDFNKHEAFSPLFLNEMANSFHSATGEPGPEYWQNRADYKIEATLDTVNHRVSGKMTLTYTNNSPYDLEFIWLQMDQNAFKNDSRSKALYPAGDRNGVRTPTEGYELSNVSIGKDVAEYHIYDTRMQIRLPKPLKANGKKIKINIDYAFDIPTHGKDRMGRVETENGWIYTLAQWFPRMAVFDEVEGWNTIPYLGSGEFYLEYGDYDFEITAPENMIVVGSGVLQNEKKVLTKTQRNRLKEAKKSDETIPIVSKEEMLKGDFYKEGRNGMLTWHFKMEDTRDIAWAASKAFIWDAAKMNLPDGETGLAQSVYPAENSGQDGYARSTEYTKHAIEIYSKDWYPYPYEVATNVGAHEGGMEYPGIVFCSYKSKNDDLWGVINHEFGHIWFPMIVGSNERVFAWQDEGLNTFINDIATEKFNNGEYFEETKPQQMGTFLFNEAWNPLFTKADVIHGQQNLAVEAYYKPAAALKLLRDVVIGPERFDYALRTYIDRWAYKHPQPWDFFNTMSNVSGEDLGWFFKGWFMENWAIDQSVESIDYVKDDFKNGATITLLNRGEMPMPVELQVNYTDETSEIINLPVEIWMTGAEYTYHLEDSDKEIASAEIDPKGLVPDANPSNNKFKKLTAAPDDLTAEQVVKNYLNAIGGKEKVEAINDLTIEMETIIQGTPFSVIDKIKSPNKYNREMEVFGQNMLSIIVNGEEVYLSSQGREQELGQEEKDYLKTMSQRTFLELAALGYQTELMGVDEIDQKEVYVLQIINPDGLTYKNYYDAETGLKVKAIDAEGFEKEFKDYKEVDGIKFPHTIHETLFGFGQEVKMKVQDIKVNSDLSDEDFEMK